MGARISNIDKTSILRKFDVKVGDILTHIDKKAINDVLDYKFYAYDSEISVSFTREDKSFELEIKKSEGRDLGIDFDSYLMDKPKSCSNKCVFCFIDQLPKGMRDTLYFKDDDARLSFLLGNYITLTNLSEKDVDRMIKMRLSPINVSVQSTNPELREKLLGNKRASIGLDILKKLADAELVINCQIVVCQGINDGAELERSLYDLKKYYPAVASISVVPAGVTKHRDGLFDLQPITFENANNIIDIVEKFGKECYEEYGTSLAFCGDELYIKAKRKLPKAEYYEDFVQFENGVGMVSAFCEEFLTSMQDFSGATQSFTIATGTAMYPFMFELVEKLKEIDPSVKGNVYAITNEFFGHDVSVAGLITGGDLSNGLQELEIFDRVLITENMIKDGGNVFLDDFTIEDIEKKLKRPVITVKNDGYELLEEIYKEK